VGSRATHVLRLTATGSRSSGRRKKQGLTLELLHLEYLERHPDGLRYTQFCQRYRDWTRKRRLSMRQVHRGGEKAFVDFGDG